MIESFLPAFVGGLRTRKLAGSSQAHVVLGFPVPALAASHEPFVVAAALTPPDAISQTMMAVPLVVLYEVGIWGAYFFGKKKPKPEQAAEA